jgi:hypothetical protein
MTTITRTLLALAFAAAWAVPAAPQSANRTAASPAPTAGTVVTITEDPAVRPCRLHCDASATAAARTVFSHQTVAERAARVAACSKKMVIR